MTLNVLENICKPKTNASGAPAFAHRFAAFIMNRHDRVHASQCIRRGFKGSGNTRMRRPRKKFNAVLRVECERRRIPTSNESLKASNTIERGGKNTWRGPNCLRNDGPCHQGQIKTFNNSHALTFVVDCTSSLPDFTASSLTVATKKTKLTPENNARKQPPAELIIGRFVSSQSSFFVVG